MPSGPTPRQDNNQTYTYVPVSPRQKLKGYRVSEDPDLKLLTHLRSATSGATSPKRTGSAVLYHHLNLNLHTLSVLGSSVILVLVHISALEMEALSM